MMPRPPMGDHTPPGSGTGGAKPDPDCDRKNPTNAKLLDFISANQQAAEELSAESGLRADFILAWAGFASGYGTGSAAKKNNNFFGLTVPKGGQTGGWMGAVPCSELSGTTFGGFACFLSDSGDTSLYLSGLAALLSQDGRHLNAALAAQQGQQGRLTLETIGNAVAAAGFNSEPINYGGSIAGVGRAISLRINCPR
jgi:hypothetical protein